MSSGKLLQIDGTATEKALSPRALTAGITDQQLQKKLHNLTAYFNAVFAQKKQRNKGTAWEQICYICSNSRQC